jgi:hypothetical protein
MTENAAPTKPGSNSAPQIAVTTIARTGRGPLLSAMRFQRVVQVERPVAEAPLVEEFEVQAHFGGEGGPAAADHWSAMDGA